MQPRNLTGDFEILENHKKRGENPRVSLIQQRDPGGIVDRPAISQPLYVNLRSRPKLVVPTKPRRHTRLSLHRTCSFEEYQGTLGFINLELQMSRSMEKLRN